MEKNLYLALHDIPTLTELAVLCLYSISICLPYLKWVRGDTGASALDLGPLHDECKISLCCYHFQSKFAT